ncbi:MAG: tetratricopeptide repeat protein [Alphaproteobacteria bacterium]|nr:tetratricopeptide repeat protein [Alphaproteobacteria bacterium]
MSRLSVNQAVREQQSGNLTDAEERYRSILAREPQNIDALHLLGTLLWSRNKSSVEALGLVLQALQLRPDAPVIRHNYASMLTATGHFDEAVRSYRRAIALKPDYAEAYFNLSGFLKFEAQDPLISEMKALHAKDTLSVADRTHLGFALAKALDDIGAYDEAFIHAEQANSLVDRPFDLEAHEVHVAEIIKTAQRTLASQRRSFGSSSEAPIFIIGMPRSGTTLCERILAAHPAVYGAGELTMIGNINAQMRERVGVRDMGTIAAHIPHVQAIEFQRAANACLDMINQRAPAGYRRFTDKMPFNFFHLGLIALLFPNARIIHVRRHYMDTAVSCFFQHFQQGHGFAYDLRALGDFLRLYNWLMSFWTSNPPLQMHTVEYEALVHAPEEEARKLIAFAGLDWHDACLKPEEASTAIATASRWQARQPVTTGSCGRWKNYERHLPLVAGRLEGLY